MADPECCWLHPPANLTLSSQEVHVWRASLDPPESRLPNLRRALAVDELDRAERFRFEEDRAHFIAARALLRIILGRYLAVEPALLCFEYSPYGKPALATTSDRNPPRFSLAHSDGLALYAIAHGREVGVDIERARVDLEYDDIAERFFSPRENAAFRTLPAEIKLEAFFNCWTRKEAYVKARGEGLSVPLDQFDVSLTPGEPARLLNTQGDPQEAARWSLRELLPGSGYVAALAVEGQDWRLKCWQWVWSERG